LIVSARHVADRVRRGQDRQTERERDRLKRRLDIGGMLLEIARRARGSKRAGQADAVFARTTDSSAAGGLAVLCDTDSRLSPAAGRIAAQRNKLN